MFFDSVALEEHKRLDYETENLSLDQVTAPVDIPEVAQVGDGREVDGQKYWLKVKSILWPCRAISEIGLNSEILKVKVYNDEETIQIRIRP